MFMRRTGALGAVLTRAMGGFTAVKGTRWLLAGLSLTLMTSALALGGAGEVAQASTSAESTVYDFAGEVHPQGEPEYCLGVSKGFVSVGKCTSESLREWGGSMLCTKVGGKELCTGSLYLYDSSGANPTGQTVGVYGPTSPGYKHLKNYVVLCAPDTTTCLSGLGWIPGGAGGTEDQMWVPSRNNAAIVWPRKLGNSALVSLGKNSSKFGAVWTHPAWALTQ
jgi:hypothetical protein